MTGAFGVPTGGTLLLGPDLLFASALVRGLVLLGSLVVAGKAALAYRQHGGRSMLLLAAGLVLLLVGAEAFAVVAGSVADGAGGLDGRDALVTFGLLSLVEQLIRLCGVGALLGSLYVRE